MTHPSWKNIPQTQQTRLNKRRYRRNATPLRPSQNNKQGERKPKQIPRPMFAALFCH